MGSLCETKSQLYRAKDRGYLPDEAFPILYEKADDTSRMIRGLIASVKESPYRGYKFKEHSGTYLRQDTESTSEIMPDLVLLTDLWPNDFDENTKNVNTL